MCVWLIGRLARIEMLLAGRSESEGRERNGTDPYETFPVARMRQYAGFYQRVTIENG